MSIGRLARFAGAIFVASMVLVGPGTTAIADPTPAPAVGVYPPVIHFDRALRGGKFLATFGVLNGTGRGEYFNFGLAGATAAWLRLDSSANHTTAITKVWAPGGPRPTTAVLELDVPSTLADGIYRGQLAVVSAPPKATHKGQTTVGLGAAIDVVVDVTGTEVVSGSLVNAYTTYPKIEVGSPVNVFVVVKNAGNVTEQPEFALQVTKGRSEATQYSWHGSTGSGLLPGQTSIYEVSWPGASTETQTLGPYSATVHVNFGSKQIGSANLPFQLVPYGSLGRGGKLLTLKLANHPQVGYSAEVQASVESTGQVQEETSFVGQLYLNGALLRGVKSPVPILLQPGQSGVITMPLPVARNGLYRLVGNANFAGATSKTDTLTFRVGPAPTPVLYIVGIAVVALLLLLLLIVGVIIWRRRQGGPPSWPERRQLPPRYTSTQSRTLHVPPRAPVGTSGTRQQRSEPN